MLTLDQIVGRILAERSDLTREDVKLMITQKKKEVGGLLTDGGAAYIVASELGVDLTGRGFVKTEIGIRDLVPGVNDVSITGRVIRIYPSQTFLRSDKTVGKMVKVLVADRTGTLNIVFWNEKVELVSKKQIMQGQVIKILHGYVREGLDGKPELHVGIRGEVVVNPPGLRVEEFPEVREFFKKINEMKGNEKYVNVTASVAQVFPVSTFQREGEMGRVSRVRLVDETGNITAVFWNDKVETVKDAKKDDTLQIMGARTKIGMHGEVEIHVNGKTSVSIFTEKTPYVAEAGLKIVKIVELKQGDTAYIHAKIANLVEKDPVYLACPVCFKKVIQKPEGVFCERCGPVKTPVHRIIINATLTDDSGAIDAVFYGQQAEAILGMSAEKAWELVSQTGDDKAPIKTVSKDILGKDIIVAGRATYDPFTGGLQLTVRELRIPVEGK